LVARELGSTGSMHQSKKGRLGGGGSGPRKRRFKNSNGQLTPREYIYSQRQQSSEGLWKKCPDVNHHWP